MESNIKGLVAAGHEMASELKAECGAVDMRSVAKLISDLATQLEVQLVRANALAAENALARKAVQAFCEVVGDNTEIISELVGQDDVLVILKAMKATGNMSATDAFLAEIRAQGVEMYADNLDNGADDAERGGFDYAVKFLRSEASGVRLFADQLRKGGNQ
ncbi:Ead/Ea22-like family protein [Escherichia coli]